MIRILKENEDAIQLFKDIIDTKLSLGEIDKAEELKKRLFDKYGVVYASDKMNGREANPAVYYTVNDFLSFEEYRKYCMARYSYHVKTENLLAYDRPIRGSNRLLTQEDFDILEDTIEVSVVITNRRSGTESAYVSYTDEIFLIESELNYNTKAHIIIHELAHIYDNRYLKGRFGIAGDLAYASSSYGTMNSGECFAEHFANYFTNPKFLENGWLEVYSYLDRLINSEFKIAIQRILR